MAEELLTVKKLKTYFHANKDKQYPIYIKAVDGVTFGVKKGEIVGLVGESGSGKSTIAYTIVGMYKPKEGNILFNGENIVQKNNKRSFAFKKAVQLVFQDPGSSLNPSQNVQQILSMPLKVHKIVPKEKINDKIFELLDMVELSKDFINKSITSVGGGEKQLIAIARALSTNPELIILDEPTSSLDVSIQAKIINRLLKIQHDKKLSYILITHDLSLMRNVVEKVFVMYLGKICESAPIERFIKKPLHPYTQMLLSSIPTVSKEEEAIKPKRIHSVGEIPSPVNVPKGCSFNTRCNKAMDICFRVEPKNIEVFQDHFVCCHLFNNK